jgi:hypothetical protein
MDRWLGTFGDARLDKGGLRSSDRWLRARRSVCVGALVRRVMATAVDQT